MSIIHINEAQLKEMIAQEVAKQLRQRPYPHIYYPMSKNWLPNFFERTAGSLADSPLERAPQGNLPEINF